MKKIKVYALIKLSALLLFFLTVIILNGCRKEIYNLEAGKNLPNSDHLTRLRTEFDKNSIQDQLNFTYNDSLHITWKPNWKKVTEKTGNDSLDYLYIPLNGEIHSTKNNRAVSLKMVNTEKYIIAYITKKDVSFFLGTYTGERQPDNAPKVNSVKSPLKKAAVENRRVKFNKFSGDLSLINLKSQVALHFNYSKGEIKKDAKKKVVQKGNTREEYQMCTYTLNCVWVNNFPMYCGDGTDYAEEITYVLVYDVNQCHRPPNKTFIDHLGNICGPVWYYAHSYISKSDCYDVIDLPPPPIPEDEGNNGGDPPPVVPVDQPPSGVDPCEEKKKISATQSDPAIKQINAEVLSHANGNEWGAKQNKYTLNGSGWNVPDVTEGTKDTWDYTFNWNETDGYTVGSTHLHPGNDASAPSPDDVFRMGDDFFNNAGIINNTMMPPYELESSVGFYYDNVSVTIVTKSGTYVVTIKNSTEYNKSFREYNKNRKAYEEQYILLGGSYKEIYNVAASQGEATTFALLAQLGKSINLYKAQPGSTEFKPIEAGMLNNIPIVRDMNCPQ